VSHTYTAVGTFMVRLLVIDDDGESNDQWQTVTIAAVTINAPPVASFTSSCSELTCRFNAGGSSDSDGTIASYAWSFGDGTTGSGATAARTYAAGGTYTVTLTVTDNGGAKSTHVHDVTVTPPAMHVGDLDGASTSQQSRWTATVTVTVHDSTHAPVANAVVSGSWNDGGTGSCTTTSSGQCAVSRSGIRKTAASVSFSVTNVARAPFVYTPTSNHDADGSSDGTTISISRR
jgi:large repetitive protein